MEHGVGVLERALDHLAQIALHHNLAALGLGLGPGRVEQKRGVGRGLVEAFLAEAVDLEIPRVFALTYQAPFFVKCGFTITPKEDLPQKVWKECINCPKFPKCDEVAVIKAL